MKPRECKKCNGRGMCQVSWDWYSSAWETCKPCEGTGQVGGKGDVFDAFCLYTAGQTAKEIEG